MLEDETCAHAYVYVEVPLHRSLLCSTGQDNLIFFCSFTPLSFRLFHELQRVTHVCRWVCKHLFLCFFSILFLVVFISWFVYGSFALHLFVWVFVFFLFMLYLRLNVCFAVVLHSRNIVRSFFFLQWEYGMTFPFLCLFSQLFGMFGWEQHFPCSVSIHQPYSHFQTLQCCQVTRVAIILFSPFTCTSNLRSSSFPSVVFLRQFVFFFFLQFYSINRSY